METVDNVRATPERQVNTRIVVQRAMGPSQYAEE